MKVVVSVALILAVTFPRIVWPADAPKLEKLGIGYPAPVASLGIIDVMRRGGLFREYGLDVDLVYIQGGPILTTARPRAAKFSEKDFWHAREIEENRSSGLSDQLYEK